MIPGERIREFRQMRGLSPEELALAANMRPAYLLDIEEGRTFRVHTFTYQKVADALGVTLGMILDQESPPKADHDVLQEVPESWRWIVRLTVSLAFLLGALSLLACISLVVGWLSLRLSEWL